MEEFEATQAEDQGAGVESVNPLDDLLNAFGAEAEEVVDQEDAGEVAGEDEEFDETQADEEPEIHEEPTFTLKVDGEDIVVKQSDLLADAQKWRSSNKRFDEAAAIRKQADEEANVYKTERAKLSQILQHYEQEVAASLSATQPDWNTLLQNDPLEYVRQKEMWNARLVQLQQAQGLQEQIKAQQAKESEVANAKFLQEQQTKVLEMFPEWKDKAVASTAAKQIDSYLESAGFSADERNSLADARLLAVAYKAALYDALVKSDPSKQKQKVPAGKTMKPGVSQPSMSQKSAKQKAALQAFDKKPSIDTLAKLF